MLTFFKSLTFYPLLQLISFNHSLSLKCTYWRCEKIKGDERITELEKAKADLESEIASIRGPLDQEIEQLKAQNNQTSSRIQQLEEELERSRVAAEQAHMAALTEGRAQGRTAFLESEEYKEAIRRARLQGARDFKRSVSFKHAVEDRAAEYSITSFEKCQKQLLKLGGIVPGFNLESLDPSKDENLQDYIVEDEVEEEDEFAALSEEDSQQNESDSPDSESD